MSRLASFVRPVNHEETSVGQLSVADQHRGPAEPAADSAGFVVIGAILLAVAVALMAAAIKPVLSVFVEVLRSLMQAVAALLLAATALVVVAISLLR
jgi:hypothetical protein